MLIISPFYNNEVSRQGGHSADRDGNKRSLDAYPLTWMPSERALAATPRLRSKPCCTLHRIFIRLKPSEALTKTATSLTPCFNATSSALVWGIRTGDRIGAESCARTPRMYLSASKLSQSASCGIACALTIEVSSTDCRPQSWSRRISSSFIEVGTCCLMFWRPSRGPTSTMRTLAGEEARDMAKVATLAATMLVLRKLGMAISVILVVGT